MKKQIFLVIALLLSLGQIYQSHAWGFGYGYSYPYYGGYGSPYYGWGYGYDYPYGYGYYDPFYGVANLVGSAAYASDVSDYRKSKKRLQKRRLERLERKVERKKRARAQRGRMITMKQTGQKSARKESMPMMMDHRSMQKQMHENMEKKGE